MGIKIVRTPSETPNITNVDDIIPFRYAYGGQDGYVIGRGDELNGTYENGTFMIGAGRAVLQGVEVDIDANGVSATLDTSGERYFKIYLKVDLEAEIAELESHYSTIGYDDIEDPQSAELIDLEDPAYLLLYTLKLNGTTEVEKNKIVKPINYSGKKLVWSGNSTVNAISEDTSTWGNYVSVAMIPEKENCVYEIHGETNMNVVGVKSTFVVYLRVGTTYQYGYETSQVFYRGPIAREETIQECTINIIRQGDYFGARCFFSSINKSTGAITFHQNSSAPLGCKITKIYEIEN